MPNLNPAINRIAAVARDTAAKKEEYATWHMAIDTVALTLFFAGEFFLIWSVSQAGVDLPVPPLIGLVGAALVAADLVSGVVHFLADNFGNPRTPVLGRMFIHPFREHHVDPLAITRHSFLETNGATAIVSLPLIALTLQFTEAQDALLRVGVFLFLLAVFLTNQIHKWAHMQNPPRWVRILQRMRLVLSPRAHAIHHAAPHDSYYCITTGWLNYPLTKLRIFPLIVRALRNAKNP